MKRILIAAAVLAGFAGAADAQTVRIATEGAYAPYNFIDEAGKPAGFEIDLGNEICRRAGLTCEFVITAWDSMIPNLLAGNYDVIMAGMAVTDERLQSIDFSAEYYPPGPSNYATRAGQDIAFPPTGQRIGTQTGTVQGNFAEASLGATNTVSLYETYDQAVADLAAGNLDLVLAEEGYIKPIVEGSGGALVMVGPDEIIGGGTAAGIRKEDDTLQATFDRVIGEMKADGSLNELIVKWFEDPLTF
jgi:polar amino acid transport system substrate-binding protein